MGRCTVYQISIRQFGSQLWLMKRVIAPLARASMKRPGPSCMMYKWRVS